MHTPQWTMTLKVHFGIFALQEGQSPNHEQWTPYGVVNIACSALASQVPTPICIHARDEMCDPNIVDHVFSGGLYASWWLSMPEREVSRWRLPRLTASRWELMCHIFWAYQ